MAKEIDLELVCDLTEDEVRAKAQAVGVAVAEHDKVDDARGDAAKAYRRQLAEIWQRVQRLSRQIQSRSENRIVRCRVDFNTPHPGVKTIIRMDTGEVVREEIMSDAERQTWMFAEDSPGAAPEAAPAKSRRKKGSDAQALGDKEA